MPTLSNHDPIRAIVSCQINASAEAIFDAWTSVDGFKFFIDPTRIAMSVGVEQPFFIETWRDGRARPHYGRFLCIQRPALLEFTWVDEATSGQESIVTFDLETNGQGTRVVLTHSGLSDEVTARRYEEVWGAILGRVALRFRRAA